MSFVQGGVICKHDGITEGKVISEVICEYQIN